MQLRPYQITDVDRIRQAFRSGHRRVLYQLSTGGGKTVTYSDICQKTAKNCARTYILEHREELIKQTSDKLFEFGVPHGIVSPEFSHTGDHIQVCSVQTIVRRLDKMPDPALIVVDEAHHSTAGTWTKILNEWPNAYVLGVTATPCRTDGRGMGDHYDHLICGPSMRELISLGYLSAPKMFAPNFTPDLSGIRRIAGDYDKSAIERLIDTPTITGDAVEHYKRLGHGKPGLVFCISIAHAQHVAATFRAAGFRAESVDGKMDKTKRRAVLDGLRNGSLDLVMSCDLISEGLDVPGVYVVIMLRPTDSLSLYLQQIGRGLRIAPGKTHAVILDHVGNCFRHGMPDEDRVWTLEGKKKGEKKGDTEFVKPTRRCPNCLSIHYWAAVCPNCGTAYSPEEKPPRQVAGTLEEISPERVAEIARKRRIEKGKAKTLDEYRVIEKQNGYSRGWAELAWGAKLRAEDQRNKASGLKNLFRGIKVSARAEQSKLSEFTFERKAG